MTLKSTSRVRIEAKVSNCAVILATLCMCWVIGRYAVVHVRGSPIHWKKNTLSELRVSKFQCVDFPYQTTTLNYCRTLKLRNQTTFMNASLHVPEVLNFINLKVKLFYKYTTFQPFMIDIEKEICKYMRNPSTNPIATYIYTVFKESLPDMFYECPHGNRTYNILWAVTEKISPPNLPPGEYRLDITFKNIENITLYSMKTYGYYRRTNLFEPVL